MILWHRKTLQNSSSQRNVGYKLRYCLHYQFEWLGEPYLWTDQSLHCTKWFTITSGGIPAFLGVNFMMSIWKLPYLKCYSHADEHLSNEGVRNTIIRPRFLEILENFQVWHVWQVIQAAVSYKSFQRSFPGCSVQWQSAINSEHMKKFHGCHSCKQYHKFDLYLGKKDKTESPKRKA